MLSKRLLRLSRIPNLRRPRPPNLLSSPSKSRLFTQNSQLLLVARHTPRPQLPYLAQPSFARRASPFDQHVLRLLSTENRVYVKDQLWLAARWTAIGWTVLVLTGIAYFGWQIETDERSRPTPAEWSFFTRNLLRGARFDRDDRAGTGRVDWAKVASTYLAALLRLEEGKDARGVVELVDGEGISIADVGRAGYDITGKSEQWRAGYFEVLMGCAEAAEQLHDMVVDKSRGLVYPREVVVGPSHPDPRPLPSYLGKPPREEDMAPAFEAPEVFYMRVLTGRGFSTQQRLDAVWRYANWLELQGTPQTAGEVYKWGVDIALAALPLQDGIIDKVTSVLSARTSDAGAAVMSSNLLSATKALAVHRARTGDESSALPMLLSILRARSTTPLIIESSPRNAPTDGTTTNASESAGLDALSQSIVGLFQTRMMAVPSQTGDEPFTRPSMEPGCEESELMLYIGEILSASSPTSSEGLAWTRQAVTIAEAALDTKQGARPLSEAERIKCKACLSTGVANWETMLQQRMAGPGGASESARGTSAGWLDWRGWFGGSGGRNDVYEDSTVGQLRHVAELRMRLAKQKVDEDLYRSRGGGGIVWIG
nr:hypothetical protein B0A51_00048 [Rachicladosporium sp. CCFEE 5018]